ncbi:MAG: helicase-related protein, partial [Patescibacteria group bacterium]
WCHLNDEGDLLERLVPGAVQISGSDSDDAKEDRFEAFRLGQARVLIVKPKIGAFGLNWQHCAHVVYFVSHSYEQYYQAVRRCWRFGQEHTVRVDVVRTASDDRVMDNLRRKSEAASRMFSDLVRYMNEALAVKRSQYVSNTLEVPSWL